MVHFLCLHGVGHLLVCGDKDSKNFPSSPQAPHASLRLAGRTNASVPAQDWFYPITGKSKAPACPAALWRAPDFSNCLHGAEQFSEREIMLISDENLGLVVST